MPNNNGFVSQRESALLSRWLKKEYKISAPLDTFWRMTFMSAANEMRRRGLDFATPEKVAEVLGREET